VPLEAVQGLRRLGERVMKAKPRDLQVPAPQSPISGLSRAQLRLLDRGLASVDSMNEAESGKRADAATLNAGQAAVDTINTLRGRP
jgi:hypothetical protein